MLKKYFRLINYSRGSIWVKLIKIIHAYIRGFANRNMKEIAVLVHSASEERMLVPLVNELTGYFDRVHLITDRLDVYQRYRNSTNNRIEAHYNDLMIILSFCKAKENKMLICCLDHKYYIWAQAHRRGIDIVEFARINGVITCCIQHGGSMKDNLHGQSTSASEYHLLWGEYPKEVLVREYGLQKENIIVVGNHMHDRIFTMYVANNAIKITNLIEDESLNILLATCLHTEYNEYLNYKTLYREYIEIIYKIFSDINCILDIKPHPVDYETGSDSIYHELKPVNISCRVKVHNRDVDIYDLLGSADIVITRASTIAEEAVMLGKIVLVYDLLENGPSRNIRYLKKYNKVHFLYGYDIQSLKNKIDELICDYNNSPKINFNEEAIREYTYKLDGRSRERTVAAINKVFANHI